MPLVRSLLYSPAHVHTVHIRRQASTGKYQGPETSVSTTDEVPSLHGLTAVFLAHLMLLVTAIGRRTGVKVPLVSPLW